MPILRDPLPLQNPPLLSSPLASVGGEMLIDIEILTVEIDLIGGARGMRINRLRVEIYVYFPR